eukprot:TRINITY_DN4894_c0_g1_i1.p1 TRINITY_DN4894_c0_g1~~TRINITY_DN4894_c0_g1_i1.p1  ORF type:complete len:474 (-),score=103.12 TRINITY_DN4894_c0_g1_i1:33-1454(-)
MEEVPEEDPVVPYQPTVLQWDEHAPLRAFAEQLSEPALANTGGAGGMYCSSKCILPLLPHCPSTAACNVSVLSFVRAVTVDPVTVWAPQGKCETVAALVEMLEDKAFYSFTLAAALKRADVVEQRLLRGAVACLEPALTAHPHLRQLFASLLRCLSATMTGYGRFVADKFEQRELDEASSGSNKGDGVGESKSSGDGVDDVQGGKEGADEGDEDNISRGAMAHAHPNFVFTAMQYTKTGLRGVVTAAGFEAIYNDEGDQDDNILRTGIWAPGLPILRAMPNFVGVASADTDLADCNHEMGKKKVYTGGSFGTICTCKHPKFIGVTVLDGSGGQRMPFEFVIQRFATLPAVIVYSFACATLKSALIRLPYVAKRVKLLVDRFHWRKSHTDCSTAMCYDAFKSINGISTLFSEERNALSRRQQHHLRLSKQDQFFYFTVYKQALSNAIALYRDAWMAETTIKWPKWYRQTHVDSK